MQRGAEFGAARGLGEMNRAEERGKEIAVGRERSHGRKERRIKFHRSGKVR